MPLSRRLRLFVSTCAAIWACKLYVLYRSHEVWWDHSILYVILSAAVSSYGEMLVAAALCFALVVIDCFFEPNRFFHRLATGTIYIAVATVLVINLVNAELLTRLGLPLTIPMIEYSDVFSSEHGRKALWSWTSGEVALLALAAAVSAIIGYLAVRLFEKRAGERVTLAVLTTVLGLTTIAGIVKQPASAIQSESGTIALLRSLPVAFEELGRSPEAVVSSVSAAKTEKGLEEPGWSIRNVVLVVLEGVGAEYLDLYSGRQGVTPNLRARRANMLVAKNAYSHTTSSTMALLSMLSARYPPPSAAALPDELAQLPLFPKYLAKAGVRTGFFHSSDTRFGEAHELLEASGFTTIQDYRARKCQSGVLEDRYSSLGLRDECTFADLIRWIDERPSQPFFAMLWTFETHYPYFGRATVDPSASLTGVAHRARDDLSRYLGAIREADRLIERLVRHLEATGRIEETLIIVTSDHGQSFGQHGTFGNGGSVYEESVRIPLLLINPRIGEPHSVGRLTGQIDIAPTIMHTMGHAVPDQWDGTSLFASRQTGPIYFLNYSADRVLGYRIGDHKVIANLVRGSLEIFNVSQDPEETKNLADNVNAAEARRQRNLLAQWATRTNNRWQMP